MNPDSGGINRVLQLLRRDSKFATYKFALLRGLVDVMEREPFLAGSEDHAPGTYPLGLLVERWFYYYIPLVRKKYPQQKGELVGGDGKGIAFRPALQKALLRFSGDDALTPFHYDYARGRIGGKEAADFAEAAASIAETITSNPMKHLGYSVTKRYYSVVNYERRRVRSPRCDRFDPDYLRARFGTYTICAPYVGALESLGGLIIGTDSILHQWAEFTADVSRRVGGDVGSEEVLRTLGFRPSDERDVADARAQFLRILERGGALPCVWCGKPIRKENLAIDHVIPFSLWGDNSRPNLMPCHSGENSKKSDKIPSPVLIEKARERMARYLRMGGLSDPYSSKEEPLPDTGQGGASQSRDDSDYRVTRWIDALKERCRRIIEDRGYEQWDP